MFGKKRHKGFGTAFGKASGTSHPTPGKGEGSGRPSGKKRPAWIPKGFKARSIESRLEPIEGGVLHSRTAYHDNETSSGSGPSQYKPPVTHKRFHAKGSAMHDALLRMFGQ